VVGLGNLSQGMGTQLPVQYQSSGSTVPPLPLEASVLANGMETFETFVDMSETAPAYGIKLATLDEFIQRTFVR
jgi:hypothetical protein